MCPTGPDRNPEFVKMSALSPENLIREYQLLPHPEGGWYREVYRSNELIPRSGLPDRFSGDRVMGTGIYFLLTDKNFSAFHRIASDEGWHFYAGTGLRIYDLSPEGTLTVHKLGANLSAGEVFQTWVPAGHWFGSRVEEPDGWALVGCTVAPGFDFADFEMAKRAELVALFPDHAGIIGELTRLE